MTDTRQVVVVTGGSAGLGRAIAERFARDGAALAIIARGRERLDQAARAVEALGGTALPIVCDVADAEGIERAAAQGERELGPIDVWINNAMVSVYSPIREMTASDFKRVTDVTYLGYVHGSLAALKRMLPRDHGVIIQVGSSLAHRAIPLQSAYCAAKHAIKGCHESLITELLHDKSHVRTTMVQLPAMNTPQYEWSKSRLPNRMQPVPPIFQREVGADAVHYAVRSDVGRELLVTWSVIKLIRGERVVPAYVDKVAARDAWDGEQTNEPDDPNRPHNLWEPVPGDWGAHGRFDDRAKSVSLEFEFAKRKPWSALGGALLAGIAFFSKLRRRR